MKQFSVVILLVSMLIMLGLVTTSPFVTSHSVLMALAVGYVLASGLSFLSMLLDPRKGGVMFMFEFFMLFFIALPSMLQISAGVFPFFAKLRPEYMSSAYGIIALSHMVFNVSWLVASSRMQTDRGADTVKLTMSDARFYTKWAWAFALIATVFAAAAGPSNLFVARFDRGDANFGGLTQQFLFMCRSISLLAMVMMLFLCKNIEHRGLKKQNIYALILFLPAFLVINYLPALPRFVLFGLILALSTAFVNYFRPRTKVIVAITAVFVLFIVFPVIKSLGAGEINWAGFSRRADLQAVTAYLLRVDFDAFMQITSTVEYLKEGIGPIRYGNNFLGVLLFFVPRGVWSGKPVASGDMVAGELGYVYTNVSSPLPAEALLGFGYIGPVVFFAMLAFWVWLIERYSAPQRGKIPPPMRLFAYALSMGFIVIVMRGALNSVAPQFATAFLCLYIMQLSKSHNIVWRT